jgi:hypothetical protein
VRDFATDDGTTDDTTQLQAALSYGTALTRRADVMVTEGTYITDPLTMPAGWSTRAAS